MSITINGSGTITGLVAGGLPDATITSAELAANAVNDQALTLFNASGSAPVYACRAWVNFNGTGTVAIRASGNVSSITDNGVGDYTVNFIAAMPDVNYACITSSGTGTTPGNTVALGQTQVTPTVSAMRFVVTNINISLQDGAYVNVSIFR